MLIDMKVKIKRLDPSLPIPRYAHKGDAGVDLYSRIDIDITSGDRFLVPTGIKIALEDGYEAQIRPRSGLAIKNGVSIVNTPGTIDAHYRGEVGVILINHDKNNTFSVRKGDRIAQMVFKKVEIVEFVEVDEISETIRGSGGFGSTGI